MISVEGDEHQGGDTVRRKDNRVKSYLHRWWERSGIESETRIIDVDSDVCKSSN